MKYLLDTNVISELQKSNCNQAVKSFMDELPPENLFLSAITIGEICHGIEKLSPCKKKHELSLWLYGKLPEWFRGRIIPLDMEIMIEWGKIRAQMHRTLPIVDSMIAAIAISYHMTLVTMNSRDFEDIPGINLINPGLST